MDFVDMIITEFFQNNDISKLSEITDTQKV